MGILHNVYYYLVILAVAIQIHFTGQGHWVTSAYIGGEVRLYDSSVGTVLSKSLKMQLKQMYQVAGKNGSLFVTEMPVQQQVNLTDCGIFSIVYAYHLAQGDEPSALDFDNKKLRQHLVKCFENEMLSPFPVITKHNIANPTLHCTKKIRIIKNS